MEVTQDMSMLECASE